MEEEEPAFEEEFLKLEKKFRSVAVDNDDDVDAAQLDIELRRRQAKLAEMDKTLAPDYIRNPENDVYFDPESGSTRVPFEKSWREYLKRRAGRQRAEDVEAENQSVPDWLTPERMHPTGHLYAEDEMMKIRKKYNHLDFNKLEEALDDADTHFFEHPTNINMVPWGPDVVKKANNSSSDDWELENLKFLGMLPVKYHLRTFRRVHGTKVGRKFSYGALVVGGNGKGWAGFGYGKGQTQDAALRRAAYELRKNLLDVPLDEGRTIPQSVDGRHGRVIVRMKRKPRGSGVRGGPIMRCIFECFGLQDVTAKVVGSRGRNPLHQVYAAFQGLAMQTSPREMALARGVNYYREYDAYIREAPPTRAELAQKTREIRRHIVTAGEQWSQRRDLGGKIQELEEEEKRRFEDSGEQLGPADLLFDQLERENKEADNDNRARRGGGNRGTGASGGNFRGGQGNY